MVLRVKLANARVPGRAREGNAARAEVHTTPRKEHLLHLVG